MQNAQGGVEEQIRQSHARMTDMPIKESKIYGKRGRRIRAKQRLEKSLLINEELLAAYKKDMDALEKQKRLSPDDKVYYESCLYTASNIHDLISKQIDEIALLNSRI